MWIETFYYVKLPWVEDYKAAKKEFRSISRLFGDTYFPLSKYYLWTKVNKEFFSPIFFVIRHFLSIIMVKVYRNFHYRETSQTLSSRGKNENMKNDIPQRRATKKLVKHSNRSTETIQFGNFFKLKVKTITFYDKIKPEPFCLFTFAS